MADKKAVFNRGADGITLNPVSLMGDEKGIYFTFQSDMGKIADLLPEPLEPAFPLVSGYIVYVDEPAFAQPYREAMLGVYAKYNGTIGMYPAAFLLSGDGAEMATLGGRERFGLPKKMCEREDCIKIERDGDVLRGTAVRKGVTLLDVSIKLGKYNDPGTGMIYNNPTPGAVLGGMSFYFNAAIEPDGTGNDAFARVNMYTNVAEYTYRVWEPGEVTVRLQSSIDDPWGELPVFANMGGAYSENDLVMKDLYMAGPVDVSKVMPKILATRYDHMSFKED